MQASVHGESYDVDMTDFSEPSASASISMSSPVTISDLGDGISPANASWTANSGRRVRIDRDTGKLEADVIYLHDNLGNGDCQLVMQNNNLVVLNENGSQVNALVNGVN